MKCVICGKEFKPRNSRHICCSFECQQEKKRRTARKWYQRHSGHYKPEPKVLVDAEQDEPLWIVEYKAADRLTKVTMLARELNNVCIHRPIFTYGNLSRIYNTEKYKTLEEDIFKRKRLANE